MNQGTAFLAHRTGPVEESRRHGKQPMGTLPVASRSSQRPFGDAHTGRTQAEPGRAGPGDRPTPISLCWAGKTVCADWLRRATRAWTSGDISQYRWVRVSWTETRIGRRSAMGLVSKLTKAGMAKKAADEARKPANQQKLRNLASKARGRGGKTPR